METREVIVEGTPRSFQGRGPGVTRWKKAVTEAATTQLGDETYSIQVHDVSVQILHFCPEWGAEGDLDNIAKPILDALCDSHRVLFNDSQVKELLLRRIEWDRSGIFRLENATRRLAARLDRAVRGEDVGDFVYIGVTTEMSLERLP